MKNQIAITTQSNFPVSKNFERKVKKLMPSKAKQLHIQRPHMTWKGHGQYRYEAIIFVNYKEFQINQRTTDSMAYDHYINLEYCTKKHNDWCKNVILNLLEYRIENIVEFIDETENDY